MVMPLHKHEDWRRTALNESLPPNLSPKVTRAGNDLYDVELKGLTYQEVQDLAELLRGKVTA